MPAGGEPQGPPDPVPPLVERYLEHVRVEKRLAARTVELYRLDLIRLCDLAVAGAVALPEVQNHHVRRWVAQMHSGWAQRARHCAHPVGLARVLPWLGREGLVASNPVQDVRAPAPPLLPKALGVDEAVQLAEPPPDTRRPLARGPRCGDGGAALRLRPARGRTGGAGRARPASPSAAGAAGSTWSRLKSMCSARAASGAACPWAVRPYRRCSAGWPCAACWPATMSLFRARCLRCSSADAARA
jgi:hypothetical protein